MFRAPSRAGLPGFEVMLADLPASHSMVARHLGLQESTVATYRRMGTAPRAVMLATFWETRWGRSAADTEAANYGAMYYREAQMHKRELARIELVHQAEIAKMTAVIQKLEAELSRDSGNRPANMPFFHTR